MHSCIKTIVDKYDSLTYSEKRFVDYVIQNKAQVIYMSIGQLAEAVEVAPSTIVATVRKLGYGGFREFKIALASEQSNPLETWGGFTGFESSENQNIFQKIVESNIAVLRTSSAFLPYNQIEKAVNILLSASSILIYGVGTSAVLAQEAFDFLFRLGLNCAFYYNRHYLNLAISRKKKDDIAFLISQNGVNRDILSCAERIKGKDGFIIGISNYSNTPFSKYCDILLAALPTLSTVHENHFSLRVPMLCIFEALYYMLAERMGKEQYDSNIYINHSVISDDSVGSRT